MITLAVSITVIANAVSTVVPNHLHVVRWEWKKRRIKEVGTNHFKSNRRHSH